MIEIIEQVTAESLIDYINIVNEFKLTKRDKTGIRNIKLFRGMDSHMYKYIPTLGRKVNLYNNLIPTSFENRMIEKAKLKMPELFKDDMLPIQTITRLQHYGLPTRLLDFTSNSLVALYFACKSKTIEKKAQDGKVLLCFTSEDKIFNCYSPIINAIADMSSTIVLCDSTRLDDILKYSKSKDYWKLSEWDSRSEILKQIITQPMFFEPELNSERIRRQQGLFLIFPNAINENGDFVNNSLSSWELKFSKEIIIPESCKKQIMRSLKDFGITQSFLFPEPENICADIFDEIRLN